MQAISRYELFQILGGIPELERELDQLTPVTTEPERYRLTDVADLLKQYNCRIAARDLEQEPA